MADHELVFIEADPARAGAPDGFPHWSCTCGQWRWTLHPDGGPDETEVTPLFQEHLP